MKKGFSAVVETGWHSADYRRYEERRNCGHAHRDVTAAEICGSRLYGARYVRGAWQANADWHGYTIHNQDSEPVEPDGTPRWVAAQQEAEGWDALGAELTAVN